MINKYLCNMKISNKKIGFLIFTILLISCHRGIPITPEANPKEWYIEGIFASNDTSWSIHEYNQFCFYYDNDIDFIPLTIYMIEQKHYGHACSYMYETILNRLEEYSITPDSITQEYLLYYLKKGIEMNDTACADYMAYLYMKGEWVDQDTIMAKNYIMSFYPPEDAKRMWKLLKKIVTKEYNDSIKLDSNDK